MQEACLAVSGLNKSFGGFALQDISFTLPYGSIMGLIGENGAGKSTTLKAILDLIKKDSGTVELLGGSIEEAAVRERLGVVFDENRLPLALTPQQVSACLGRMYSNWQQPVYEDYLQRLSLPPDKPIKDFSRGMKMKMGLVTALSHQPQLLLLDEATSGLDPVVRDEVLEIFLDFVKDGQHSILFSSHITSDLEKAADRVTYIHQGRVLMSKHLSELREHWGVVHCDAAAFQSLDRAICEAWRERDGQYEVLVNDKSALTLPVEPAALDEIMVLSVRGCRK